MPEWVPAETIPELSAHWLVDRFLKNTASLAVIAEILPLLRRKPKRVSLAQLLSLVPGICRIRKPAG